MDHEPIRQSVAAYALHALTPEDHARVQQELLDHLPGCDACSALMRDFREIAADLAMVTSPRPLSTDLERRVTAAIRDESGAAAVPPSRRRKLFVRVAAVAASVAIVASWATTAAVVGSLAGERETRERLAGAIEIAGAPGARVAALRGAGGSIVVAVRPDGRVALVATGVPEPPRGRVMELWLLSGDTPVPVAAFSVRDGAAVVLTRVRPGEYAGAAITFETGFVPAPTADPVYRAALASRSEQVP